MFKTKNGTAPKIINEMFKLSTDTDNLRYKSDFVLDFE